MRALGILLVAFLFVFAAVGVITLLFAHTDAPVTYVAAQSVPQSPSQAQPQVQAQQAAQSEQPVSQSQSLAPVPDAPASEADWIALVAEQVGAAGSVVSGYRVADPYGAVVVRLGSAWTLPAGWEAHTSGETLAGGTLHPGVWSVYPPCNWRESLRLSAC